VIAHSSPDYTPDFISRSWRRVRTRPWLAASRQQVELVSSAALLLRGHAPGGSSGVDLHVATTLTAPPGAGRAHPGPSQVGAEPGRASSWMSTGLDDVVVGAPPAVRPRRPLGRSPVSTRSGDGPLRAARADRRCRSCRESTRRAARGQVRRRGQLQPLLAGCRFQQVVALPPQTSPTRVRIGVVVTRPRRTRCDCRLRQCLHENVLRPSTIASSDES